MEVCCLLLKRKVTVMLSVNPVFCSQASFAPVKKQPKTYAEIMNDKMAEDAKAAKQKPADERTVGDYLTIGLDTVNNLTQNVPVVYANSPQKLNIMA